MITELASKLTTKKHNFHLWGSCIKVLVAVLTSIVKYSQCVFITQSILSNLQCFLSSQRIPSWKIRCCNSARYEYMRVCISGDEAGGLAEGDLVWGAVRGSPAWPGQVVGAVGPGELITVRWFGGMSTSPTRVRAADLQTLSEGLDAHHRASNNSRRYFFLYVSYTIIEV